MSENGPPERELNPPRDRGATLGGRDGGTLGGPDGFSLGPQQPQTYRVRLTSQTGRFVDIDAVDAVDLRLEHSTVSDLSVEVPPLDGLGDFRLGDFELFYGDRLLWTGTLEEFPGPTTSERATLAGRGPARSLTKGSLSISYSSATNAVDIIRDVWRDDTRFTATVSAPPSGEETVLGSGGEPFEAEGTPLEVLQTLHETAGMRFTVQYGASPPAVESYTPGEQPKDVAWTPQAWESTGDVTDYYNLVNVVGDGASATASDAAEISANGEESVRIDDPSLTTAEDCQARADSALRDGVNGDTFSGTVDIIPQLILPGYHYLIPEFNDRELPVDKVEFAESRGDAVARLQVNAPDGPTDVLSRVRKRLLS